MRYVEALTATTLILLLVLVLIFVRREYLVRRGAVGMSMRLTSLVRGRGWAPGLGRFTGDELLWYRLFSLGLRPRRVLVRRDLRVDARRAPEGPERLAVPESWVVLHCTATARSAYSRERTENVVDLALAERTVTGFMSWIESAPPRALQRP